MYNLTKTIIIMNKRFRQFAFLVFLLIPGCSAFSQNDDTQSDLEEMYYLLGIAQTQGLKEYLEKNTSVDLQYESSFLIGVQDGAEQGTDAEKAAYLVGTQIGLQIVEHMIPGINKELLGDSLQRPALVKEFMKGFSHGFNAPSDEVVTALEKAQEKMQKIKETELLRRYSDNKIKGEKFLAKNLKKKGVKSLPSGVQFKIIKKGNGPVPAEEDSVRINYEGRTVDGEIFDSTYETGEPVVLNCNEVIYGMAQALTNMPVGSIWEIYIPQDLAYAEREHDMIKPFSALIFKIELLGIEEDSGE